jgi:acyl-CoA synthetase (NDP forming)
MHAGDDALVEVNAGADLGAGPHGRVPDRRRWVNLRDLGPAIALRPSVCDGVYPKQPFLRGGAELLAGVVHDPVFGPLVAFGPGGVFAELIGDAAFRIAPLTDIDAEELVHSGKTGRLVAGFRGAPAADDRALLDLVNRLSVLAQDVPEIAELDLNPVIARPDGCSAVDARVRVARPSGARRLKSW